MILIPEVEVRFERSATRSGAATIAGRTSTSSWSPRARRSPIDGKRISVADEKRDPFGHVRLGNQRRLRPAQADTGYETRYGVPGTSARRPPSAFDQVLRTRFGIAAVDLLERGAFVHGSRSRDEDRRYSHRGGGRIAQDRRPEFYDLARVFFSWEVASARRHQWIRPDRASWSGGAETKRNDRVRGGERHHRGRRSRTS
jgi:hypothetical protein